ncbi:hypothetical protein RND71_005438 [Anisodus tanguticus]|uniref:Uncharacterized protein n=1 Tax=Anisodus tanguticus TaxID=243964 RepID=A0AAE1SS52_9SOLA|nr:hypothetical protein RND71_005438 [Anisodus tanguticus]
MSGFAIKKVKLFPHFCTILVFRECPENCKEPVGYLMFAAARLADLLEFRQLRTMFNERYGNSLECNVNKQFAEKLKPVSHKADVKLQLMQDIAAESGVEWNSIALQQKLYEQKHKDVSGNNKESEAALSNHENAKHHHTESSSKYSLEHNGDDDAVENAQPKSKSVRRKHMDPQSGDKDSGHENHGIKIPNGEVSRQRNRDGPSGRAASLPGDKRGDGFVELGLGLDDFVRLVECFSFVGWEIKEWVVGPWAKMGFG